MTAPTITSFSSEVFTVEVDGHVATLWLDRPEKRNAMGPAFWDDLPVAMAAIGGDPSIRAVVVAARGPHFSVGLDLVSMAGIAAPPEPDGGGRPSGAARARHARASITRLQASVTAVADCPVPVIAAVHGWCIGVGTHVVDQADGRGTVGADVLAGEGQFGHVAPADDGGQSLQAADVGDDGDLRLAHREDGVRGRETDVTGAGQVNAAADAVAVDRGDYGDG